jgi:amino-acid N-acetyltransferase
MISSSLRGILTYTSRFRDRTFVLAVDSVVLSPDSLRNLVLDIAVLRSVNINIVLVHGASQQIESFGKQFGVKASNSDGMGVTDAATLQLAITAGNAVAHELLEAFSEADQRAMVSNAIIAHPAGIISGRDLQHTGRVERVDVEFLQTTLNHGIIPIIPPFGFDGEGRTFRVNSDGVALAVARSLKAAKLIFLGPSNGVAMAGKLSAQFSVAEAEAYVRKNRETDPPELTSKLEHAVAACLNGVNRAHIVDGRTEEALLREVFSNEGIGTMVYANEYEAIRKAKKRDVRSILRLVRESVQAQEVVQRSEQEIISEISNFYVYEIDKTVLGCAALHFYEGEPKVAELACVVVSSSHENQGIGRKMMHYLETRAREAGVKRLIVLSTRTFNYFQQKGGFTEGKVEMLPPARLVKYEASGRNSKVLYKDL